MYDLGQPVTSENSVLAAARHSSHLAPGIVAAHTFIPEFLIRNGFRLTMLREEEVKLEDVFMKVTKGIVG